MEIIHIVYQCCMPTSIKVRYDLAKMSANTKYAFLPWHSIDQRSCMQNLSNFGPWCHQKHSTSTRERDGWLVEQGLTSHSTQFRSFRRRCFYRSDDPTNSVKALKEGERVECISQHHTPIPLTVNINRLSDLKPGYSTVFSQWSDANVWQWHSSVHTSTSSSHISCTAKLYMKCVQ